MYQPPKGNQNSFQKCFGVFLEKKSCCSKYIASFCSITLYFKVSKCEDIYCTSTDLASSELLN